MKKQALLVISFFSALALGAQEVIATQGGTYSNSNGMIDFTVGEVVVNTENDGSTIITQGFQQTNWNFLGVENHSPSYEANIYPNPTAKQLNIQTNAFVDVTYTLYDGQGKIVLQDKLRGEKTSIEVAQLKPGNYSLNLNNEGKNLKTFKLIKTQ